MDRWTLTLHLLLLFSARSSLARGVSDSQPAGPRAYPCPNVDDIAPCICKSDPDFQLFMDCSSVKNDEELTKAFNATFPFTTFTTLTIDQTGLNNNLVTLSQFSFGEVSFEHIEIRETTLTTVEEGTFRYSHETLLTLLLVANDISSFTFEVIGEFTKLTSLQLNGNNFDGVPIQPISSATLRSLNLNNNPMINVGGDFVKDCPALQQLHMRNTGQASVPLLEESPISMIDGLGDIITVDFSGNTISTLQTNTFSTGLLPGTIHTINLSGNGISIVFPNFVTGLVDDSATVIDLSQNSIEFMDQAVWEEIFTEIGQGTVNLSENPLVCGCEIAWLVVDNPGLMDVLGEETRCFTGELVTALPVGAFDQCP